ncbi:carboxymuconolactone decarboxylase family protein [Candidatus Poriferisocius sp.]|uniref:carboxymuconolactone decarboxylase family protein n=1 Tax=Candidatus Poriferisocius sp. TaxID=3101276 RepID=UPI003B5CBE96
MNNKEADRVAWANIMGDDPPDHDDLYLRFTKRVFSDVWSRPRLGRRERRLTTLTAIAATGNGPILPFHMKPALESGDLTPDELAEWVVQLAHYAGWPASAQAYTALRTVVAELGLSFEDED